MKRSMWIVCCLLCSVAVIGHAAPYKTANKSYNVNLSTNGLNPAGYYGAWSGHTYFKSPADWRNVGIYQFITDRFCDGNPKNNDGKYKGYDLYDVGMRHGGDFKGAASKLDYIKSLGYNGIWISPVFQNRFNSYHGYGQIDFTLLDDRFGTLSDLRALTSAAHARGMYVIVDIVVNHMENLYYFEGHPAEEAPFRMHAGEYRQVPRGSASYADFWVDNTFNSSGSYCDVYDSDGQKKTDSGSGSFWFSDFHHNGDLQDYGDAWQNHLGKIYGMYDDLRTTHPRVQDKIIAMTKSLIASADIDGIRVDTPMQVPLYFFKRWCPAVKQYAASLGKTNFLMFGEFYCNRGRGATMVGRGREPGQWGQLSYIDNTYTLDGGINYRMFYDFFQPAVKDQTPGTLGKAKESYDTDWLAYDFYHPEINEHRYEMVNFFNNHDQWRMVHAGGGDGFQKTDLAGAILAYWPGIPAFYSGDEQGFCSFGSALDGAGREDMMASKAWFDVAALVATNPAIQDNFDMCNPHYRWVQKVMNARRQYPALRQTDMLYQRWLQSGSGNGIYAFSRAWGEKKTWALVVFNTWKESLLAGGGLGDFYTGWDAGNTVVNALNPSETYVLGTGGKLNELWVGPYETKVFVRSDNLQALDPAVEAVTPAHDARVTSPSQTIRIKFTEPMVEKYAKSAFRFDGKTVPASQLSYDAATRTLSYNASGMSNGIHTVQVYETAKSVAGKKLYGKFMSRFRLGSNSNPIANVQKDPIVNPNLIEQGMNVATSKTVWLYHDAPGAKYVRARNAGGNWGSWATYAPKTTWTLGSGSGSKTVEVQYWADGSAAYFSKDSITLP